MVEINMCSKQLCSNVSVAAIDCSADSCKLPSNVKEKCKCYQRVPDYTPIKQRICCEGEQGISLEGAKKLNDILNYAEFENPDKEEIEKRKKLIKDLKNLRKEEDQICGYYDKDDVFYSCGPDCCNEGAGCPGECIGAKTGAPQSSYKDPKNLLMAMEGMIIDSDKESPAEIITNTDRLFSSAIILLIIITILLLIINTVKWAFKTIAARKSYKYIASAKLQQGYKSLFNLLGQFTQKLQ